MYTIKRNKLNGTTILVLCLLSLFLKCESARILAVFPTPSLSHQIAFRSFTQELVKNGHEMIIITTDPAYPKNGAPSNLTEIDIHDVSYTVWINTISNRDITGHYSEFSKDLTGKNQYLNSMKLAYTTFVPVFEAQISSEQVQQLIKDKNKRFDLLILEAWPRPLLAFSHLYKIPVVTISSFVTMLGNYETVGAPTHPILCPSGLRLRVHNLSLLEKLSEIYLYYSLQWFYKYHEDTENKALKRLFGPDIPTVSELSNNVGLMFLNQHPIWEGNWPVPPSVIHIGGIHLYTHKAKPLPKDLQTYLDNSNEGVIYVSFGTNVSPSSMNSDVIRIMLNVFSKLPYDILWKWDKDELPGKTNNIKIGKWFPQRDLFDHPNIKLFITQGGLQSTDEAIFAGVPMIGIPMLGDQWFNTEKYVHHKIGMQLDLDVLTEEMFKSAIKTVIEDESYRLNVIRLQRVMHDQPQRPLQRAIWWTEHVLRHGADHLRAPTANISWIEYYEVELVLILAGFVFFAFMIIILLLYYLYCTFKSTVKPLNKEKRT